jgi:hypothetical protein
MTVLIIVVGIALFCLGWMLVLLIQELRLQISNRPVKKLLKILLNHCNRKYLVNYNLKSLCFLAHYLYDKNVISYVEYGKLKDYIQRNNPGYYNDSFYYWSPGSVSQRREWLEHHIKSLP